GVLVGVRRPQVGREEGLAREREARATGGIVGIVARDDLRALVEHAALRGARVLDVARLATGAAGVEQALVGDAVAVVVEAVACLGLRADGALARAPGAAGAGLHARAELPDVGAAGARRAFGAAAAFVDLAVAVVVAPIAGAVGTAQLEGRQHRALTRSPALAKAAPHAPAARAA